ncbi:hypothetical protein Poly51_13580 [Rubripirellula tenax]|uniref:DUF4381 domain-containing protein n=1 Tax=Rubripirellula tenax TaxID=2528015 RepID=A0A5C6FG05_9BACT|nr:DUF4381 domain-containing protein [Rubripirellula tenax]TWU58579.1 hypothetical protein Poly51_13580 [Rubripirellula tenax]
MESPDPASLDNLNEFVLPDPVGWLPLAPVWKFLISIAIVWLTAWVWIRVIRFLRNAYRRQAIGELAVIEAEADVVKLNELLKRTAMTAYGRDEVASLHGERWVEFLHSASPPTSNRSIAILGDASSQPSMVLSADKRTELFAFARDWICHHSPKATSC